MNKKNEKRVRMVLYKMHDYDLVAYACSLKDKTLGNPKISFYSVVKGLLNQYAKGEVFTAPRIKKFTEKKLPSKVTIRFTLDEKADKELIELFDNIRDRQKNSFLKSLVRRNLNLDGLTCYFKDDFDTSKFSTFNFKTKVNEDKKESIAKEKKKDKTVKEPVAFAKTNSGMSFDTKLQSVAESDIKGSEESSGFDFFGAIGNINN